MMGQMRVPPGAIPTFPTAPIFLPFGSLAQPSTMRYGFGRTCPRTAPPLRANATTSPNRCAFPMAALLLSWRVSPVDDTKLWLNPHSRRPPLTPGTPRASLKGRHDQTHLGERFFSTGKITVLPFVRLWSSSFRRSLPVKRVRFQLSKKTFHGGQG